MNEPADVTQILAKACEGDPRAVDRLFPLVYDELRALAEWFMKGERANHTLQPTALVHEAYLKLVDQTRVHWKGRAHFLAVASMAIRRILVDHARGHKRAKRGGGRSGEGLMIEPATPGGRVVDMVALDEALNRIGETEPELIRIVEMHFFAGMTIDEIAGILEVSKRTVERKWRYARALLYQAMSSGDEPRPT